LWYFRLWKLPKMFIVKLILEYFLTKMANILSKKTTHFTWTACVAVTAEPLNHLLLFEEYIFQNRRSRFCCIIGLTSIINYWIQKCYSQILTSAWIGQIILISNAYQIKLWTFLFDNLNCCKQNLLRTLFIFKSWKV